MAQAPKRLCSLGVLQKIGQRLIVFVRVYISIQRVFVVRCRRTISYRSHRRAHATEKAQISPARFTHTIDRNSRFPYHPSITPPPHPPTTHPQTPYYLKTHQQRREQDHAADAEDDEGLPFVLAHQERHHGLALWGGWHGASAVSLPFDVAPATVSSAPPTTTTHVRWRCR